MSLRMTAVMATSSSPGVCSGHKEKKGRSNSRAARQTASIVAIHPAPPTRELPPSPDGSFSPAGTESHKTSMSLKQLLACFASDMLRLYDFDLRPYRSNESL